MDDRLRICLWMVGGGALGAVLGGIFGALTAVLYARNGGAAGTGLARRVAEAFLDTALHPPSDTSRAALVGAVDGLFFLGILGLFAGALLGISGRSVYEFVPLIFGSALLVGAAAIFGTVAYALTYRPAVCLYIIAGSIVGGLLAENVLGSNVVFPGAWVGGFVALFLYRVVHGYSPKFHSPRVGKTTPLPRSDTDTDITGSPSQIQQMSRQDANIRKKEEEQE